nr:unnamed protein product [Spirometra erinaceieuropaei]
MVTDENASVENRWCQLRDTVQSYALSFLGSAHRQHQDWLNDKGAAINNLFAEKNRLHKAYVERPSMAPKQPSIVVAALCSSDCARCRTPGWLARSRRSKGTGQKRMKELLRNQSRLRSANQRRMRFQSRVFTTTVPKRLFTDDCVLNTTSEEDTQRSMGLFATACVNLGLLINTEKTVVKHQPPPDAA